MASNTALSRTCAEPIGIVVAASKTTTATSAKADATNTNPELDGDCCAESTRPLGAAVVGGLVGGGLVGGVCDGVSCGVAVVAAGAAGSSRRLAAAAPCETGDLDTVAQVAGKSGSGPCAGVVTAVNVWQVAIFCVMSVSESS